MNKLNDAEDKNILTQKLFTSYLLKSLQRNKSLYLQKKAERELHELLLEDMDELDVLAATCNDSKKMDESLLAALPALSQLEDETLSRALQKISTKMLNILVWHVLDQRSLLEISELTGDSYTSVRQNYSRLLKFLKKEMGVHEDD